jgi:hypothetical protein
MIPCALSASALSRHAVCNIFLLAWLTSLAGPLSDSASLARILPPPPPEIAIRPIQREPILILRGTCSSACKSLNGPPSLRLRGGSDAATDPAPAGDAAAAAGDDDAAGGGDVAAASGGGDDLTADFEGLLAASGEAEKLGPLRRLEERYSPALLAAWRAFAGGVVGRIRRGGPGSPPLMKALHEACAALYAWIDAAGEVPMRAARACGARALAARGVPRPVCPARAHARTPARASVQGVARLAIGEFKRQCPVFCPAFDQHLSGDRPVFVPCLTHF